MIRAFTLVETVIVVAFSLIMVLAIALLAYNFNKISVYEQTSARSSGSASAFMREVVSLTSSADAVLQTHTFAASTRTSSSTALVLEIPSINSSGSAIPNTYDYAAFYITGTNVYRLLEPNAASKRASGTKLLSSTASSTTFSYNSADVTAVDVVTVDIQTRATVKQDVLSDHLHEQIRLRNH